MYTREWRQGSAGLDIRLKGNDRYRLGAPDSEPDIESDLPHHTPHRDLQLAGIQVSVPCVISVALVSKQAPAVCGLRVDICECEAVGSTGDRAEGIRASASYVL